MGSKYYYVASHYMAWVLSQKWHRYLARQYLYPLLCLVLLFLLLQWNWTVTGPGRLHDMQEEVDEKVWRVGMRERGKVSFLEI